MGGESEERRKRPPCNPPARGETGAGAGEKGAEEGAEENEKEERRVKVALENTHGDFFTGIPFKVKKRFYLGKVCEYQRN